jgi:hypothetical protein
MSKKIKLSIDTVDGIVDYISMLESRIPEDRLFKMTKDQSEAIADMLVKLADARYDEEEN